MDCTQVKFEALQTGALRKAQNMSELCFETLVICVVSAASEE